MYILVVRKDKKVVFQKEFKTFNEVMEKYNEFNFEKDKLTYNIYRNMRISEIIHDFLGIDEDMKKLKNELKDLLEDL